MRRAPQRLALAVAFALGACRGSCGSSTSPATTAASSAEEAGADDAAASAEPAPRCRADGAPIVVPGEDVVVGEAVTTVRALFVGAARRSGGRHVASVVEAPLDLSSVRAIDVGLAAGDDPPPALRVHDGAVFAAFFARKPPGDGGARAIPVGTPGITRQLDVVRIEGGGGAPSPIGSVAQHADESMAFDLAWSSGAASPLVAWDEDAPPSDGTAESIRGIVKVQLLGGAPARVVSPETTNAEAPRLLARAGGFWLAWLASKPEKASPPGDASAEGGAPSIEGPGERRTSRWVEIVALDAKGEATSPVRRASPSNGHVVAFDLASGPGDHLQLVVQDETATAEGAGGRIVRYAADAGAELVDGGVGRALADLGLGETDAGAPRWLAWTDTQDRARLAPLGASPPFTVAAPSSAEPSLDGVRLVAASPEAVYGAAFTNGVSLRRFACR